MHLRSRCCMFRRSGQIHLKPSAGQESSYEISCILFHLSWKKDIAHMSLRNLNVGLPYMFDHCKSWLAWKFPSSPIIHNTCCLQKPTTHNYSLSMFPLSWKRPTKAYNPMHFYIHNPKSILSLCQVRITHRNIIANLCMLSILITICKCKC